LQFEASPDKKFARPYLEKPYHKKDWQSDSSGKSKSEALSSNPSAAKKKRVVIKFASEV
jgi:hypothetical protein